jgi:hypothetical protein
MKAVKELSPAFSAKNEHLTMMALKEEQNGQEAAKKYPN